MNLIIGSQHITPLAITRTATGVEAVLQGAAVLCLLDAAFHGAGTIEILGGDLDRRRMEVAGIEMSGRDTTVTLVCAGPAQRLI